MSASSTDLPRTRAAIVTAAEVVGAMPVPFSISTRTSATTCRATKKNIVGGIIARNSSLILSDTLLMAFAQSVGHVSTHVIVLTDFLHGIHFGHSLLLGDLPLRGFLLGRQFRVSRFGRLALGLHLRRFALAHRCHVIILGKLFHM